MKSIAASASLSIAIIAIASLCGCDHDALQPNPNDLSPLLDLSSPIATVDLASSHDLGPCTTHSSKKVVPLTSIAAIDRYQKIGSTIRLLVDYHIRACDVPADIAIDVAPGNATDFVTITAKVWAQDQPTAECSANIPIRRAIRLPDYQSGNSNVAITDGSGGPAALRLSLSNMGIYSCSPEIALGAPCPLDCQCIGAGNSNHRCVSVGIDSHGTCAIPCSVDGDCVESGLDYCDTAGKQGIRYTCVKAPSTCGCDQGHCAFRQSCSNSCICHPTSSHLFAGPCTCDSDCAPGGLCDPKFGCFTPCTAVSDCPPEGLFCDGKCQYGI